MTSRPGALRRVATRVTVAVVLFAMLALAAVAWLLWPSSPGSSSSPGSAGAGGKPAASAYAGPGPYAAAVTTEQLASGPVDVWYPTEKSATNGKKPVTYDLRAWLPPELANVIAPANSTFTTGAYHDLPAARGGPFPVVLFAHGLYSFRDQSTFLTTHLASWGYIVAAPEMPLRDITTYFAYPDHIRPTAADDLAVLADTEELTIALNRELSGRLQGKVETLRVAVVGHSLGGLDAIAFAARPEVAVYAALAAGFTHPPSTLPEHPSLYVSAGSDHDVSPSISRATFDAAPTPKNFTSVPGGGHLAFTDLCSIGSGDASLAAMANAVQSVTGRPPEPGAPFSAAARDGCGPGYPSPASSHALIDQAVTASLELYLPSPARLRT